MGLADKSLAPAHKIINLSNYMCKKGYKFSLKTRKRMSDARKGENNPSKRPEVRKKISESKMGDKNPSKRVDVKKKLSDWAKGRSQNTASNWKGENVGKMGIHIWLRKYYGKADQCENPDCEHKSETYDWANIKNHIYRRRREDFMMLCHKCHKIYDNQNRNK